MRGVPAFGLLQPTEKYLRAIANEVARMPSKQAWQAIFDMLRKPTEGGRRMEGHRATCIRPEVWKMRDAILRADPLLCYEIDRADRAARKVRMLVEEPDPVQDRPTWMDEPAPCWDS